MLGKLIGLGFKVVAGVIVGALAADCINEARKDLKELNELKDEYYALKESEDEEDVAERKIVIKKLITKSLWISFLFAGIYSGIKICYWIWVSIIMKSFLGFKYFPVTAV